MYSLFALYLYNCTKSRIEIKFALSLYLFSPVNKVVLLRHLPALGSDNSIQKHSTGVGSGGARGAEAPLNAGRGTLQPL